MTTKQKKVWPEVALAALFVASVFLQTFAQIGDTEAWLHLSLGRLIWDLKGVPNVEMFTYPIFGTPFSYNSWLFGLLCYALDTHFGAYGLVLLKASVIAVAFYILLRDSLRPYGNYPVAILVLVAVVMLSQYRFVLRPDMFLMVFLSFSIFSLNAYLHDGRKYIYALPAVHLLWANMHASVIVMFVPFLSFIFGSVLQRHLSKRGIGAQDALSNQQLKIVTVIFIASFVATLVGPYPASQYLYGPKYVSSSWHTQNIIEMLPPVGVDWAVLFAACAAVALSFVLNRKRISFIHLFLVIPFMVIPFISIRFQFMLAIVGGPVVVRNIMFFLDGRGLREILGRRPLFAVAAAAVVISCALGIAGVAPFGYKDTPFGFGYDHSEMPKGAVEYLDRRQIYGKVFNPFHYGQYIIWTGYPQRTVFTDARGHLPGALLSAMSNAAYEPRLMDELQAEYGFEVLLLQRPVMPPDTPEAHRKQDLSFQLPDWSLVYWDDNSYVYLKRGGKFASIIEEDEYKLIRPLVPFSDFIKGLNADNIASYERELKRNVRETGSSKAYMFLSLLYLTNNEYQKAIEAASNVTAESHKTVSYIALGDAYRGLGDLKLSLRYYDLALKLNEIPGVHYRAGRVCAMMGDSRKALKYYERALDLDDSLAYVYPEIISTYRALGMSKEADNASRKYEELKRDH
jgi:tetratricopeptide (TPR) repeat protein